MGNKVAVDTHLVQQQEPVQETANHNEIKNPTQNTEGVGCESEISLPLI